MGQEQSNDGDKQNLVTNSASRFNLSLPSHTENGSTELLSIGGGRTVANLVTGGSASMVISGNIGNIDTNTFRIACRQLLEVIKPSNGTTIEGFANVAKNTEEIIKLYDDISTHYKKQMTQLLFTLSGRNNNNILLGTSSTSSSANYKPAFNEMVEGIRSRVTRTKAKMDELVAVTESNARRSLKRSNSFGGSSSSLPSPMSSANLQSLGQFDWSTVDNKHRYFEIRDEAEIILSHSLEEILSYKEIASKLHKAELQGLDYSHPSTKSQLDITYILDEFGSEYWKSNFGGNIFSVDKECFLDVLDTYFQDLRNRKTWVDEITQIIDPTSDGIVSLTDFRTVLKWFGPFTSFFFNPIDTFLQTKHFWGSLSSIEAQELLDKQDAGTYVIRFCETEPGAFHVSCVEDNTDDGLSFFDTTNTILQNNRQTYHYLVRRKKDEKEGKLFFVLTDSDIDYRHETIESLLKQYHLTFKFPFQDETKKEEHVKKKKGEDEVDFVSFVRSQVNLSGIGDDEDNEPGFVQFRGRSTEKKKKETKGAASTSSATTPRIITNNKAEKTSAPNPSTPIAEKKAIVISNLISAVSNAGANSPTTPPTNQPTTVSAPKIEVTVSKPAVPLHVSTVSQSPNTPSVLGDVEDRSLLKTQTSENVPDIVLPNQI